HERTSRLQCFGNAARRFARLSRGELQRRDGGATAGLGVYAMRRDGGEDVEHFGPRFVSERAEDDRARSVVPLGEKRMGERESSVRIVRAVEEIGAVGAVDPFEASGPAGGAETARDHVVRITEDT